MADNGEMKERKKKKKADIFLKEQLKKIRQTFGRD